jgi:energy-coupling factor transporter ATP-binding protein EcfA2
MYENRLASRLSGGNQRKLSLAIALMGKCPVGPDLRLSPALNLCFEGDPDVILIDEFSTGAYLVAFRVFAWI